MIDLFTLALTHGLILIALWRLAPRDELDDEEPAREGARNWRQARHSAIDAGQDDA